MDYYSFAHGYATGINIVIYMFLMLTLIIFMCICQWKIYKKAGRSGWESFIPVYNVFVLFQIAGQPLWNIILLFIPIANIIVLFEVCINLAHKFGKSTLFGIASVFFSVICFPILAFGKCEYNGGTSFSSTTSNNMNNNYQTNNSYSQNFNNMQNNYAGQSYQNTNVNSYPQPVQQNVNTNLQGQQGIYQNNNMNYQQPSVTQNNQSMTTPTSQEKTCPYCGTKVDINASFCYMCGKNIQ